MFRLKKAEAGFTFIEVLITLVLLGFIATAFLSALASSSKAVSTADERTLAESLARTQIEAVQQQGYQQPAGGEAVYTRISGIPTGWSIESTDKSGAVYDGIKGVTWNTVSGAAVTDNDNLGIQRVNLIIMHGTKAVLTLAGFVVNLP
jgi:prepilin-type N-terminal cleavage/methylation domain-containing protein